jgi:hypothetical protein
MYSINRVAEFITRFVFILNVNCFKNSGRHTISVVTRLIIILAYLVIIVHVLACGWIWLGYATYLFD